MPPRLAARETFFQKAAQCSWFQGWASALIMFLVSSQVNRPRVAG